MSRRGQPPFEAFPLVRCSAVRPSAAVPERSSSRDDLVVRLPVVDVEVFAAGLAGASLNVDQPSNDHAERTVQTDKRPFTPMSIAERPSEPDQISEVLIHHGRSVGVTAWLKTWAGATSVSMWRRSGRISESRGSGRQAKRAG